MSKSPLFVLLPLLLVAACGAPPPQQQPVHHGLKGIQFSPNGEPLDGGVLGTPSCDDAMARWLARVDANGDGVLDRQEFLADTRAQFARMDLDHDGFITADELWTFRQPYVTAPPPPKATKDGDGHRQGRNDTALRAVAPGSADPVMSADANLDFRVSLAEFVAQAESVFASFDTNNDNRLSLAEIQAHGCTVQPNRPIPVE